MNDRFRVEKKNKYCIITYTNKPVNALTIGDSICLSKIIRDINMDKDIRAIIITGGIKYSFCAGSELNEISDIMNQDGDVCENMVNNSKPVQEAFTEIENSPKVIIGAINGVTIGLGFELALVCDIRISSEIAWFKMAQVNIGIIPGAGGTQRLPRIVGLSKAKEYILTGRKIAAREALEVGLVNELVPHGHELARAEELACIIASNTPGEAVRLAKQSINSGIEMPLELALVQEMKLLGETYEYQAAFEGIQAVMEKRKPNFTGDDYYVKG